MKRKLRAVGNVLYVSLTAKSRLEKKELNRGLEVSSCNPLQSTTVGTHIWVKKKEAMESHDQKDDGHHHIRKLDDLMLSDSSIIRN